MFDMFSIEKRDDVHDIRTKIVIAFSEAGPKTSDC